MLNFTKHYGTNKKFLKNLHLTSWVFYLNEFKAGLWMKLINCYWLDEIGMILIIKSWFWKSKSWFWILIYNHFDLNDFDLKPIYSRMILILPSWKSTYYSIKPENKYWRIYIFFFHFLQNNSHKVPYIKMTLLPQ